MSRSVPSEIPSNTANIDHDTVEGFGEEWAAFDQEALSGAEQQRLFGQYFSIFPFEALPQSAEGFDLGCGSGRWAELMADRVARLHCIDPSQKALGVSRRKLASLGNVSFHLAAADSIPLPDSSQDFGYSLGVLHHVPNTAAALCDATRKLKRGAPFLLYLYYDLDDRPQWFRLLWRATDYLRRFISRLPFALRRAVTDTIAVTVYWPLARLAALAEKAGADVSWLPLSGYRYRSFYSMRTDALDRFGTRIEQRFSKEQIATMMEGAGLANVRFREDEPYWVACGLKS